MLAWYIAVLLVCPSMGLQGAVWKDPATGKWVEISEDQLKHDSRLSDGRVDGGDGGGFFGDFFGAGPSDPSVSAPVHTQAAAPRSSKYSRVIPASNTQSRAPLPRLPVGDLVTNEKPSHSGKYTRELGIAANVQTQASTTELPEQDLVQTSSVESFVHEVPDAVPAPLKTSIVPKNIGNLCRYQGMAPLTGCPEEATNGCVDRIPCERECAVDAYFHYRCKGPQEVSPEEMIPQEPEPVAQPDSQSKDEYVKQLSERIRLAMENNDYSALARLIVDAQQTDNGQHLATMALAQMAQHRQK
jgi:hypothetical protein